MVELNLTINGKNISAPYGATLLEAARSEGIEIPTLCHHEKLASFGACRLCTVEIFRNGKSRLVASCAYHVEEGLVVETDSEPVINGRKMILEWLWARAPGVQVLRQYAAKYGADLRKFETAPTYCLLCGLCVRYCQEVKKKNAIGFVGRGIERGVMIFPDIASKECAGCGECYSLCPTGVLPSNYGIEKVPHFDWPTHPYLTPTR